MSRSSALRANLIPPGGTAGALPLTDGSDIHQWASGGIAAATVSDLIGVANLTANETATFGSGTVDALQIPVTDVNGIGSYDQHYESPDAPAFPSTTAWTVSGWVLPRVGMTSNRRIMLKQDATNWTATPYAVGILNSGTIGRLEFIVNAGGGAGRALTSITSAADYSIQNAGWSHIGMAVDAAGALLKAYVNGALVGSTALNDPPDWSTGPWMLGGRTGSTTERFQGSLFDWRVAEVERDAHWFRAMYRAGRLII